MLTLTPLYYIYTLSVASCSRLSSYTRQQRCPATSSAISNTPTWPRRLPEAHHPKRPRRCRGQVRLDRLFPDQSRPHGSCNKTHTTSITLHQWKQRFSVNLSDKHESIVRKLVFLISLKRGYIEFGVVWIDSAIVAYIHSSILQVLSTHRGQLLLTWRGKTRMDGAA